MSMRLLKIWMLFPVAGGLLATTALRAQDEPPPVPKGVEVMARGPVHEAFATPTSEPEAMKPVTKRPPKALEEMPPDQKPDGDVIWVPGYWAWDDDRKDYLWVSGIWRTPPPGKQWIAGYWRDADDGGAQWVPGFWTVAAQTQEQEQQVNYLPEPPQPPAAAPPGAAPTADAFWVPGSYEWYGDHYVWRAGYWGRVQPGYVWVSAHYRWTPSGYVYIPGYWDLAIAHRGVLFAPVVVDTVAVGPTFVYTPSYVVCDTVVLDALFVRPCYCHYYFGDYYGPAYREIGFESCVVYSRSHYDSIIVYNTWEHRDNPAWLSVQVDLFSSRDRGLAPLPPRTLVQQTTIINQNVINQTVVNNNKTVVNQNRTVLMPASKMAQAKGGAIKTVAINNAARTQIQQQSRAAVQQVAAQRVQTERPVPGGKVTQPHAATLNVSKAATLASPARTPATTGAAHNSQVTTPAHPQGGTPAGHAPATGTGSPTVPSRPGAPGQPARPGAQPAKPQPRPQPRPQPHPQQDRRSGQQSNNPH
jgi:hypothetical protein